MLLWQSLLQSLLSDNSVVQAFQWIGWLSGLWALPLLVLYLVLPFRWGRRAQHWWVPGLAYGLGVWLLAVPQFIFVTLRLMAETTAAAARGMNIPPAWTIIPSLGMRYVGFCALALCLTLAASLVGWRWRERSVSALGRAQAA